MLCLRFDQVALVFFRSMHGIQDWSCYIFYSRPGCTGLLQDNAWHSGLVSLCILAITIPCIAGVSEEIRRVCWNYDVRVAFKTGRTLRSKLTRVKDPLPLEKQAMVVYRIPCSCGKVYIGKTIWRMELRLKGTQGCMQPGPMGKVSHC